MVDRIVFDTNVWISGVLWRGKPYQCLQLARAGVICPVFCEPMSEELLKKLKTSFDFPPEDLRSVEGEMRDVGEEVEIKGELKRVSKDPDDDKFLECALVAEAWIIVSGDRHLLEIGNYEGVRILSPSEFLLWLGSHPIESP